jgi:hypothetical protein
MDITKAQYYETHENIINVKATINGVELCIPQDPNNRHWQAIQKWVAEGNTIEEAD